MDTRWFAIDREGRVALLDSGEGGAVPNEGTPDEGAGFEQMRELKRLLSDPEPAPTPDVHATGPYGAFVMLADASKARTFAPTVDDAGAGLVRAWFALETPQSSFMTSVKSILGVTPKVPAFARMHAAGACRGCRVDQSEDVDFGDEIAQRFGLYFYAGPAGIAEPYERTVEPANPLDESKLGDLASKFARFPGRFSEHAVLQPFEHWPSVSSWSASYVGTDGKVRCAPGREEDYRKEHPSLSEEFDDVEPPK
jgi:hypothetical protein